MLFSAATPPFSSRGRCEPSLRRVRDPPAPAQRGQRSSPRPRSQRKGLCLPSQFPQSLSHTQGTKDTSPSVPPRSQSGIRDQPEGKQEVRETGYQNPSRGRKQGTEQQEEGGRQRGKSKPRALGARSGRALSQASGRRFVQGGAALMRRRHSPRGSPATAPRSLRCPFPPRRHLMVLSNLKGHC